MNEQNNIRQTNWTDRLERTAHPSFIIFFPTAHFLKTIFSHRTKHRVKLILALFGLGYFLLDYLNYDMNQFQAAAVSVGALLLDLYGIFIMFGGLRKRK